MILLEKLQYLLENTEAKFVEIRPEFTQDQRPWILNVREIGPKEWDYFGVNVKLDSDNHIVKMGRKVGILVKTADGYSAQPLPGNENVDHHDINGSTPIEAIFRFIKYYFSDL